MPPESTEL